MSDRCTTSCRCLRWIHYALCAAVAAAPLGCSQDDGKAEVRGIVTVDGEPAKIGGIAFFPVGGDGGTAGGKIVDGAYTARVAVGEARVEIRVSRVVGARKLYDSPDSPTQEIQEEVLPDRYHNATELRMLIKPGLNEQNWELTSK